MEFLAYQLNIDHCTKHIWVDNCTTYNMTPTLAAVLAQKQTTLKYLPTCATYLCQPANTFIISNIKDEWTKQWKAKKFGFIQ